MEWLVLNFFPPLNLLYIFFKHGNSYHVGDLINVSIIKSFFLVKVTLRNYYHHMVDITCAKASTKSTTPPHVPSLGEYLLGAIIGVALK